MGEKTFEPNRFNTRSHKLIGHFERYDGNEKFENGEPEFDEVREEIANHYGVPFLKNSHIFIIDNETVANQRHHRAFCVVLRKNGEEKTGWYIDGRMPHATMMKRLYGHYGIPKDDKNEAVFGFIDPDGFDEVPDIQKKAEEQGKLIQWFVRDTMLSPEVVEFQKEL